MASQVATRSVLSVVKSTNIAVVRFRQLRAAPAPLNVNSEVLYGDRALQEYNFY